MNNNKTAVMEETEVNAILALDTTPWYRKKNLRTLYFVLAPSCLGVEMTSGYDSSVLNGLQAVDHWGNCKQQISDNSIEGF